MCWLYIAILLVSVVGVVVFVMVDVFDCVVVGWTFVVGITTALCSFCFVFLVCLVRGCLLDCMDFVI